MSTHKRSEALQLAEHGVSGHPSSASRDALVEAQALADKVAAVRSAVQTLTDDLSDAGSSLSAAGEGAGDNRLQVLVDALLEVDRSLEEIQLILDEQMLSAHARNRDRGHDGAAISEVLASIKLARELFELVRSLLAS